MAKITFPNEQKKIEQLGAIIAMIETNQRWLSNKRKESQNGLYVAMHGNDYYINVIRDREYIHKRLTAYYFKKLAAMTANAYDATQFHKQLNALP